MFFFPWNHFNKNKDIKVLYWTFWNAEVLIQDNNSISITELCILNYNFQKMAVGISQNRK